MKQILNVFLVVLLSFFCVAILSFKLPGNPSKSTIQIASGGGSVLEAGGRSTFVFNAVNNNGTTTGSLVYKLRGFDFTIHMDINCLNIVGNVATMSGSVTNITGTNIPYYIYTGANEVFTVVDGDNYVGDQISDLIFDPTYNCDNIFIGTYLPVKGNISLKSLNND